jgi:hypothetical protein
VAITHQLREATGAALRGAVQELSLGRWNRFREDLQTYLATNADQILDPAHLNRFVRLARATDAPLADLCRARGPRLEFALYLAAVARLCADRTIRSRAEFDEQRNEMSQAIWTLGEQLRRPPTPQEIQDRLSLWVQESAGPQREKMVLIAQLIMRSDWATYVKPLWERLDRKLGVAGGGATA